MKTIFYESLHTGLIPVEPLHMTFKGRVTARIKRDVGAYKKGELVKSVAANFAVKAGTRNGFIMVKPARYWIERKLGMR